MRLRAAKTDLEEAGESTDGMAESTASLRAEMLALTGVDLMESPTQFKSTYKFLEELAGKWKDLTDIQRASVIELAAGKHQGNVFSSLMENFDIASDAVETSLNSSGSAMKEHSKWSESLEAKLLKLKASWQSLAQTFMNSDFLKATVDVVIDLVGAIDSLIDNFGILGTVGLGILGKGLFTSFISQFKGVKEAKATLNDFIDEIREFKKVSAGAGNADTDATNKNTVAQNTNTQANLANAASEKAKTDANVKAAASEKAEMDATAKSTVAENLEAEANAKSIVAENAEAQANIASATSEITETEANAKAAIGEAAETAANTVVTASEKKETVENIKAAASEAAETKENIKAAASEAAEAAANTASATSEVAESAANLTGAAGDVAGGMASVGSSVGKTIGKFSKFALILTAVVTVGSLVYNQYKKMKEEEAELRQETIATSDAFLEASSSFEQAYIKYSGKTNLTAEEEAELEAAVNGTVEALDNKSSSLSKLVNSSNDYVASLEKIKDLELQETLRAAENKKKAAKGDLEEAAIGWEKFDGSEVNIKIDYDTEAGKIAEDMESEFFSNIRTTGRFNNQLNNSQFRLSGEADVNEIINYYNTLLEYQKLLEDAELTDDAAYTNVSAAIDKMTDSIGVYTSGVYEAAKAQYQLDKGIPKTLEEYLAMREKLLTDDLGDLSMEQRLTFANTMDSEYKQAFDLSEPIAQARSLVGIIDGYGENQAGKMEAFINMRTAVNSNECTVGDYISQFGDIENMTKDWTDKEKEEFNLTFGIDTDKVKEDYDTMLTTLSRGMGEDTAKEFLNGLTANELAAAVSLKGEVDWENGDPKEILKQIEEEAKRIEAISFTIDISVEKEKLDNLISSISESVSGTGLSVEGISLVEDMFKGLGGYDQSKLFERTANGIHLNSQELSKLNDEYAKTNVDKLDKKMSALGDEYNQTREELYSLAYGTDEYNAKARDLSNIEAQINALETLGTQYQALASEYNQWQMAESAGSQRDMYESIIEGFENVENEISRGWYDEGTIEFLELLTGKELSTASISEIKKAWKSVGETIEGTKYSVKDFFTTNEDGESTNTGVYNFLRAVEDVTGEVDVVKRNKKGDIIGFDFQVFGGDEAIAEALGVSEELVQIMLRAADDAGFVVSMDGTYQQLDVLKEKAQAAANELKNTFKVTEHTFNLESTDEGTITKDYNEALKIWDKFKQNKNADGTVNMNVEGAEEAYTLVSTLQSMVDKLAEPVYMQLKTSEVEKDLQTPLSKLQEYERLTQTEHQLKLKGTDTSGIEADKEEILDYFEGLSPEIKAQLGIENLSREELEKKIETGEIEIPATIDLQVEMNQSMRDMVNIALYNAGLIDEEELKKRVNIELYAETVDTSDVEEKTEDAVEGEEGKKSVVEKEVDVETYTNTVDTSDTDKKTDEAVKGEKNEKSVVEKPFYVKTFTDSVDTSKTEEEVEKAKEKIRKRLSEEITSPYSKKTLEVAVEFLANTDEIDNYTPEQLNAIVNYIVNTDGIEEYTPEQKEALVTFFANTTDPDSYTPEQKQAIVDYLAGKKSIDEYDPDDKEAIVNFLKNSGLPDSYQPDPKTGYVTFEKDSSIPDGYIPPTPPAPIVIYKKDSSKVDSYDPPDFVRTVTYKIKEIVSKIASGGKSKAAQRTGADPDGKGSGGGRVNGTANVNGTVGRAFKQGSWGTKNSGTALVGELGREILVRDGRYYTVGDNGAEFVKYQRGDIIFNHVQSEELFKNGKVTSGGGRAKAFVNGTAFAKGSSGKTDDTTEIVVGKNKVTGETYTKSKDSDDNETDETFDWIETKISRVERAIDNLDRTASSTYKNWSTRNKTLVQEIGQVGNAISVQQAAYQEYMRAANAVGLSSSWASKVRNGAIDIDTITDEVLKEKIQDYQNYYQAALDCKDAIAELKEKESDLYKERFDNVATQYEGMLSIIEHEKNMLDEYISQSEASGWLVSENYYKALSKNEEKTMAKLEQEKKALLKELETAMRSGTIAKGSEEWYNMVNAIDEVTLSIAESETALKEYEQTIQQLKWEQFDLLQDQISAITEEADFLIELMSNKKLFDDKGQLTSEGTATLGMYGQNYNVYMHQADLVAKEAARVKKELEKDPYDHELEEHYRELISRQQEYILSAEDAKNAIKDLVEEGIELEISALEELIDKYTEALNSEKDLYDYQRNIEEQTRNIGNLRKELSSYSNVNDEETQARVQSIKLELENAERDLEETLYDRYITDTEKLLDDLQLEYSELLNGRLDIIDSLISEMIERINTDSASISDTINAAADNVGYTLSDSMKTIWSDNATSTNNVIAMYGDKFLSFNTTVNTALNNINTRLQNMISQLNNIAAQNASNAANSSVANSDEANASASGGGNTATELPEEAPATNEIKVGGKINAGSAKIYDYAGDTSGEKQYYGSDPRYTVLKVQGNWIQVRWHKLNKGVTGWFKKGDVKAYATGKQDFNSDEIAWTQEKGREMIVRPSDGAILTPIAKGDSVLNANASNNIWDMANSPTEFIRDNLNLGVASTPNSSTSQNYTQNFDNITFSFPQVKNYDEMLISLRDDRRFEKLVTAMTIDRIAGKSSLGKNKSIR